MIGKVRVKISIEFPAVSAIYLGIFDCGGVFT